MIKRVDSYLKKLKDFYVKDGSLLSKKSLASLEEVEKSITDVREMSEFKRNSHAEKLHKSAVARYRAVMAKLLNTQKMTQEERDFLFIEKSSALWWIEALGGDPLATEKSIEKELEATMKRLKLL